MLRPGGQCRSLTLYFENYFFKTDYEKHLINYKTTLE